MATASITIDANTGQGIREYAAAALDVLDQMQIQYQLTPMSTNVQGEVETICKALTAIHKRCHELGAPRVVSFLMIDDRTDVEQTLASKIEHTTEFRAGASR
jgi:uncharacterized protein (TIGR00106 family)